MLLSHIASNQLVEHKATIADFHMNVDLGDTWLKYGALTAFPAIDLTLVFKELFQHRHFSNGYGSPKHKTNIYFFFWLLLKDRLNTRNLLLRRNMSLNHTLVCCVWKILNRICGISSSSAPPFSSAPSVMLVGLNWVFSGLLP